MSRETCRMMGCDRETRNYGDIEYPNSSKDFRVSRFGARFCSVACELKYEHIRADARDAMREPEPEPEPRRRKK